MSEAQTMFNTIIKKSKDAQLAYKKGSKLTKVER